MHKYRVGQRAYIRTCLPIGLYIYDSVLPSGIPIYQRVAIWPRVKKIYIARWPTKPALDSDEGIGD